MKKLCVYTICWNEEFMLPYFLRHYSQFADKIVVIDNGSTDKSKEIVKSCPIAELGSYDTNNEQRNTAMTYVKNNCWKINRKEYEWAIVCDVDELLYHPNIDSLFSQKATIYKPTGYDMYSEKLPTTPGQIYEEIKQGVPFCNFSKTILFKPNSIREMNWGVGCHDSGPMGNVIWGDNTDLKLLHFQRISLDYILMKYKRYVDRMSQEDKDHKWGGHYMDEESKIKTEFYKNLEVCEPVLA